jgi:hypothetical protein
MTPPRAAQSALTLIGFLLLSGTACLAQHAGDIGVGRSAAHQLRTKPFDPNDIPCFDPSFAVGVFTLIGDPNAPSSYRTTTPGFDANFGADAPLDYYELEPGASIRLVAQANMSPAFHATYGSQNIYLAGDYITLGSEVLHRHPIFIVDCNSPQYDPLRTLWYGDFILRDIGSTGYADSAPFRLRLSIVDCTVGDVNGDGSVNFADINAFVNVLQNPTAASVDERCAADANRDGYVNFADINAFVELLQGGG